MPLTTSIRVRTRISKSRGLLCLRNSPRLSTIFFFAVSFSATDLSVCRLPFLFVGNAYGLRSTRLTYETSQHHDGDNVRNHLDELDGNIFA